MSDNNIDRTIGINNISNVVRAKLPDGWKFAVLNLEIVAVHPMHIPRCVTYEEVIRLPFDRWGELRLDAK